MIGTIIQRTVNSHGVKMDVAGQPRLSLACHHPLMSGQKAIREGACSVPPLAISGL